MSEYNEEFDEQESGQNTQVLELIMRDYLPYWPVLVLFSLIGLFLGNAYLQTQVPVYKTTAKILLKDETQESTEGLLKQAVTGKNNSNNVDGELEIITSQAVMRNAALKSMAQFEFRRDGRIRTMFEDVVDFPYNIEYDTFNVKSAVYQLDILPKENRLKLNGVFYPLEKFFTHDGNRLKLSPKPGFKKEDYEKYSSDANHTFYFHINALEAATQRLSSSFSTEKDKTKEFLLNLAITQTHAKTGKRWLQAIIESYQQETQIEKQKKNRFMMEFITNRMDYLSRDIDSIEQELVQFQKDTKLDFKTKTADKILGKAVGKMDVTQDIDNQLFMLDELEKYLKGQINEPIMIPPAITGVNVGILNTGFMELYTMEREFSATKETLGQFSEKMKAAQNQINLQKRVLTESVNNARKTLRTLKEKAKKDMGLHYQEYESMVGELPATELAFLDIKKQLEIKNALYTFLMQRREESAIQVAGITSDIRVLSEPNGAEQISPKPLNILGGFTGASVALILLILFIKSATNNKILARSEIERRTKIPVIGEIIQTETDSPLIMKEGNRTLIAEQFRGLRTNLSYLGEDPSKSALLISSSFPGEGKSFIAANIAIGYALAGKRTVIIESDLRKPNIAKHFSLSRRTGLSVFLSGNTDVPNIIFEVDQFPNLFVIPAGPIPPNPVELILNGRYKTLIETLRKEYDHIIIDCPPIGLVTDAYEIGSFVDYAIFVTRHRYTPREAISNILDRTYREKKFKQSAIVFNGLKGGISGYGYGYNYSYGYGGYGYGYGYGYGSGYGYGYGQSYGYYGSEKRKRNRLGSLLWNVFIAPFGAFFGIRKK
jgi:tyrosine-protein kinase Etk/Wzc